MPRLTGNQDPAEGSRQTINHELARQDGKDRGKPAPKAPPKRAPKSPVPPPARPR